MRATLEILSDKVVVLINKPLYEPVSDFCVSKECTEFLDPGREDVISNVNEFVDCIIEDRAPVITGSDARAALELVLIPHYSVILYGALISLILFAIRIFSVKACTFKSPLKEDEGIMRWMVPRGLAPAVLSILVLSFADQFPEKILKQNAMTISELVFIVIIATILICTFGTYIYSRKLPHQQ